MRDDVGFLILTAASGVFARSTYNRASSLDRRSTPAPIVVPPSQYL